MMARRRTFTAKFKTQVVLDLLTRRRSMAHICREHDLKEQVVARWRAAFLDGAETVFGTDIAQQRHLERTADTPPGVVGVHDRRRGPPSPATAHRPCRPYAPASPP